ncbi:hypothetical protein FRUB_09831 [Fimbriiglobus ruber]|uniref:Uncharacterized protein n=1 Tax=Fimbriiglobus ruber TaxID=1908690 RepID=A0A225DCW6_9BACT|nr:hypothetical protein FRUB_09831 [Fimbriiglobus ruber]
MRADSPGPPDAGQERARSSAKTSRGRTLENKAFLKWEA